MDDLVERADQVVAHVVRRLAGDRVVERGAQRPHVARRRRRRAARPPRVRGRPGDPVTRPVWRERGVVLGAGDAEVVELRAAVGDQDVAGLHVAVDDPVGVGLDEGVGRLAEQRGRRRRPRAARRAAPAR